MCASLRRLGLLKPTLAAMGDHIVRKGEVAREMYFMLRGEAKIINPLTHQVVMLVGQGEATAAPDPGTAADKTSNTHLVCCQ